MSTRPEDAHPEYDYPTPSNLEEWSEEQLSQFRAAKDQELEQEAQENARELNTDQKDALDALTEDVPDTQTVDLGRGVEIDVKSYADEDIERKMGQIRDNRDDLETVRAELIDVLVYFIEDEKYGDRAVWRAFASQYGLPELAHKFYTVVRPYLERASDTEAVDRFRKDRPRSSGPGSV